MNNSDILNYIEAVIKDYLPDSADCLSKLAEAMNYAMTAGGKRIRPQLMLLTYLSMNSMSFSDLLEAEALEASKVDDKNNQSSRSLEFEQYSEIILLRAFMTALEMIHTHSLIHDDLPALDNDSVRRGRPTVHVQFDESTAILAGDSLLNYAYETLARGYEDALIFCRKYVLKQILSKQLFDDLCSSDENLFSKSFDDFLYGISDRIEIIDQDDSLVLAGHELALRDKYRKAFRVLSSKTGIQGMLGGQGLDVQLSGMPMTDSDRDYIYKNKTAALIEAPVIIGACIAGAYDSNLIELEKAGEAIGLAFQVQDDILDMVGDEEKLGKEIHQDERNEKNTYVASHGLDASKTYVRDKSEEAIQILSQCFPESESRDTLLELILGMINREK